VAQELAYLAIGVIQEDETTRKITRVWRIKNLTLKKRHELTVVQAGKLDDSDALYWLFELQPSMLLGEAIEHLPIQNFRHSMKLTTLRELNQASNFADLDTVYKNAFL